LAGESLQGIKDLTQTHRLGLTIGRHPGRERLRLFAILPMDMSYIEAGDAELGRVADLLADC